MTNKTVLSDEEILPPEFKSGNDIQVTRAWVSKERMIEILRATEQALLQSPEIQQLCKDAERYRWLLGNYAFGDGYKRVDYALNSGEAETLLSDAIDEAMELEP